MNLKGRMLMIVITWIMLVLNVFLIICGLFTTLGGEDTGSRFSAFILLVTSVMNLFFTYQYIYG